jgi:hypothetical protein
MDWLRHHILSWLGRHLLAVIGAPTSIAFLTYLAKKFGDKILDALPGWIKRKRQKLLTDFVDFYRGEIDMHSHAYVPGSTPDTGKRIAETNAVESLCKWMEGTNSFFVLSGERGIGKSRTCIELAKKVNPARRFTWVNRDRVRWINIKYYKTELAATNSVSVEPLVKEEGVYVYDNYSQGDSLLPSISPLILRKGAKLLVVSKEFQGPASKLLELTTPLDTSPSKMAGGDLREVIRARAAWRKSQVDELTIDRILRLADGIPGVAVLCVDRFAKRGRLEGIDTLDDLYSAVFSDLQI